MTAEILSHIYTFFLNINFIFIIIVLFSKKNPTKIISWLLVLYFIPPIGFVLYLFFGINWRKRVIQARVSESSYFQTLKELPPKQALEQQIAASMEATKKRAIINIATFTTHLPVSWNNSIQLFNDTDDAFQAILFDISQAKHHIHLEYYIFQNDETGKLFKNLLLNKAKEKVKIKLILDALGSKKGLDHGLLKDLHHPNIEISLFHPFFLLNLSANHRNHRKIVIIDGTIGYLGGMNIGNEYLGKDLRFGYWRDTVAKVSGDAVLSMQAIFFQDWFFTTKKKLQRNSYFFPDLADQAFGDCAVQIMPSSPHEKWDTIAQLYFEAIASAEKTLYITTPYFIPDEALLMALKTAALGGCDVKILIPGKPDNMIVYLATFSFVEEVMEAGVEFYVYNPHRFIHSKVITVDGVFATIGSANVDQRSMNINFEINALIYNSQVVNKLNMDFLEDIKNSTKINSIDIKKKNIIQKTAESVARLFSPIL
ncbi:MAG: cardiolipin synthase [Candidatus Margulisbacteria bacterium]|nr:cardiolipin synthase [Candidatus Margulisiibacteriota bacterium]